MTHNVLVSCVEEIVTWYLHPLLYLHSYLIVLSDVEVTGCSNQTLMIDEQDIPAHL
jgi:hypothetical protein